MLCCLHKIFCAFISTIGHKHKTLSINRTGFIGVVGTEVSTNGSRCQRCQKFCCSRHKVLKCKSCFARHNISDLFPSDAKPLPLPHTCVSMCVCFVHLYSCKVILGLVAAASSLIFVVTTTRVSELPVRPQAFVFALSQRCRS